MEISYKNTFWEILQFNLSHLLGSWIFWISLGLVLFVMGDLAVDVAPKLDFSAIGKMISFLLVLCGGFSAFLLFIMIVALISVFYSYRTNQEKWGKCKIEAKEEGLFAQSPLAKSEIKWSAVGAIKKKRNVIYMYITKQMAYVIPKRAFANESEFAKFFSIANEFWVKERETKSQN
jgi:hypothetical protein